MVRRIVVLGAIFILLSASAVLATVTAPVAAQGSTPAAVHIACMSQHGEAHSVFQATIKSLGTLIAPNVILTHNHYGPALGQQPADMFAITDKSGHVWQWRASDVQLIVINAGTAIIWLPEELPLSTAVLENNFEVSRLAPGNWLSVNYWDEDHSRLAQHNFQISEVKDSLIQLADPDRLIQPGDSGGGAYWDGKLIGNIWSINLDSDHQPMGSFNIALLPAQVRSYVR